MNSKKTIIITGGAGFIGSALIRYIINNTDFKVVNVDKLTYSGNLESLDSISQNNRYSFEKIDICDGLKLEKIIFKNKPDLIIDMATLTGASRVAMGTEVPSFFCNDDDLAMKLIDISQKIGDPLWQLPLWENYSSQLNSAHADFKNIGNSMFGGAITAALFLQKFVKNTAWIHVDLMAWTRANKFSSYEGGEAMGIRALFELIKKI